MATNIAPWLAVSDGDQAVEYYKKALGAVETYRLADDDGRVAVAQINVDGDATFWIQEDPDNSPRPEIIRSIRIILNVDDPDTFFQKAIAAGATAVFPVNEEHGWRTGRVTDPFGHDWEFSKQIS